MRAGTYPARGYATLELSGLELSFTGACTATFSNCLESAAVINLPVPDRPQLLYIPYWGLQEPVFLLNSRLTNFCCVPTYVGKSILHSLRSTFLPSSLNHHYPYALVFSTNLPVSVCGTDDLYTPQFSFPGNLSHSTFKSCDPIVFITCPNLRRDS